MKIFVVRHASAVERFLWDGDDSERPLDKMGADQSLLIAEFFSEIKISSIYSSLAVRCQQTIWPTARQSDVQVELSDALFEGSTKKNYRTSRDTHKSRNYRRLSSSLQPWRCHK